MIKIRLIIFALITAFGLHAQNSLWLATDEERLANVPKVAHDFEVGKSSFYHLNRSALQVLLAQAPDRQIGVQSEVIIPFPVHNGTVQQFKVYKASVLHPDLEARFPEIQSYIGFGVDDKTAMIRFSTTVFGFHGMIMSARTGNTIINPYTKDLDSYMVFAKKNATTQRTFECLVQDSNDTNDDEPVFFSPRLNQEIESTLGIFRTYRMAMACTFQYANFHINAAGAQSAPLEQRRAVVLAAMAVSMTRVNGIYERDMSITMQLVPDNVDVIFIGTHPFTTNTNTSVLINQSQTVIDQNIGFFNYDIGHTVFSGGGGLAQLNSPCTNNKARGVTGLPSPVGDPFDVDYLAHEIGHQFGARHTFNNSCNNNRSNATAVEPGSGSTIMAYAGICAPNVQANSDDYFHAISLNEMINFTSGIGGSCSDNQQNPNNGPVIAPLVNRVVPISTPLVLRGSATDVDGDELTYTWEQTNNNISAQPPVNTSSGGPNFRSLRPSLSPNRFLPNLFTVLQGSTQNAWEVIPSVTRTMNFAFTVRDNGQVLGGRTARGNMMVTFTNTAGPFVVTSQNMPNTSWTVGETQLITWNVANTNVSPVNAEFVNILLSTNGGQSFDIVLASNTPNDGNEQIVVPNAICNNCRVMVEAANNIFYNVNSTSFSIGFQVDCLSAAQTTPLPIPDGVGQNQPGMTVISELTVTENETISDIQLNLNVTHSWIGDLVLVLEHPDGTQATVWNRNCNNPQRSNINATFKDNAGAIVCATPTSGIFSPSQPFSVFLNKPTAGVWKLRAADFFINDTGTVNQWSLDFNCEVLSQNVFEKPAFVIYPNPNKGKFTVQSTQPFAGDLNVQVFDISGRRILQNTFAAQSQTQAEIVVPNASKGVYLVQIFDGEKMHQHKIVVD